MKEPNFRDDSRAIGGLLRKWGLLIVISVGLWVLIILGIKTAVAAPYMGDCKLSARTHTVSIDPTLGIEVVNALNTWNDAFIAEYGFPVFAVHYGEWQDADVLITAHGDTQTWVNTRCKGNYIQRGNNLAVVHIGPELNPHWLTHEIGHVLGFADYIFPTTDPRGFDGYGVCQPASAPISIMSYCWQQNPVVLLPDDLVLIHGYWR